MITTRTSAKAYVLTFFIFFLGIPLIYAIWADAPALPRILVGVGFPALLAIGILGVGWSAWWTVLERVSTRWSTGCLRFTVLYIFFVLFGFHLYATLLTFMSLVKGREFVANRWLAIAV